MIRIWHHQDGSLHQADRLDDLPADWTWVDVHLEDEREVKDLALRFGWSDLAVEDAVVDVHYPRVDFLDGYLFVVLHGLDEDEGRIETSELDAFLGPDYLVTVHRRPSPSIDWLADAMEANAAYAIGAPDLFLAVLAETIGRRYLPLLDSVDDRIEELESAAIEGRPGVLGDVQALRRDIIVLRRVAGPQREVLLSLGRPVTPVVSKDAQLRFDSAYDHAYRFVEDLDTARSLLASVLDTYRSTVAERTNEAMKVLTVYTAILLPLTLIAGIYGMNFLRMPELHWRWGYFGVLALMMVIAVGQWIYFVRRGFIGKERPLKRRLGTGLASLARLPIGKPKDK
ncbi:MAG: magnesium/cobalt transporter CorA [Acidimicrobiia bacterium]